MCSFLCRTLCIILLPPLLKPPSIFCTRLCLFLSTSLYPRQIAPFILVQYFLPCFPPRISFSRRKPRPHRISAAAKRRKRRERPDDSAEKKGSNSIMDGKIRLKSVIVCLDRSLETIEGEKLDTCKPSGFILAGKSTGSIPGINDDNGLYGPIRSKRSREEDRYQDASLRTERTGKKSSRNSLDDSSRYDNSQLELSRRDRRLLSQDEMRSELKDVKSSDSRKRRRHKEKQVECGASACEIIMEKGLENKSSFESSNGNDVVPIVEKHIRAVEGDASSIPRTIRSSVRKKLLVLDLNGLLCDVVHGHPHTHKPHGRVGMSTVFKRPFCDDFMKFCCEKFDIGVWSSRKMENVQGVVNFIMSDIKDNLLFCWDASRCTYTGFKTIENRNKPLVLKQLKKMWDKEESSLPWEKGDYSPSNTLLLDDSPYKALCNPPHTGVFPYPYSYTNDDDNSLGPGGDLRVYLEGLALADDVQCYIQEHPFGRRAITTSNPSWNYYEQVINKIMKFTTKAQ